MGLDQSLTGTGVTIWEDGVLKFFLFETKKTKGTKTPSIDYTLRIQKIVKYMKNIIYEYGVSHVLIEGLSFGSTSNIVFDLGGLSHCIRTVLVDLVDLGKVQGFCVAPPTVVKKFYTGKGNASKLDMIQKAEDSGIHIPFMERIEKKERFNNNVVDSHAMVSLLYELISKKNVELLDKVEPYGTL